MSPSRDARPRTRAVALAALCSLAYGRDPWRMPSCTMNSHLLVIGNDPAAAEAIRQALAQAGDDAPTAVWVESLSDAVARLAERGVDAILLDLALDDRHGMDT